MERRRHRDKALGAAAFVLGFSCAMSALMEFWAEGRQGMFACISLSAVLAVLGSAAFMVVVWGLRKVRIGAHRQAGSAFANSARFGLVAFIVLSAVFLGSLLCVYPGYAGNDSMDIIRQATGEYQRSDSFRYDGLSNHHPVSYVLLVRAIFALGTALGGGMPECAFLFLAIQVLLFAAGCAWALAWCNSHGCARVVLVAIIIVLALLPVYAVHAITLWKDGLFAVSLLAVSLTAYDVAASDGNSGRCYLAFVLACLVSTLLRSNGIYIGAALVVWMLAVLPETRKRLLVCGACVVLVFGGFQVAAHAVAGVESGHFAESVGIPLQQIALAEQEGVLDEQDEQEIARILPLQKWRDSYETFESNGLKFDPEFDDAYLEAHKLEFMGVWAMWSSGIRISPRSLGGEWSAVSWRQEALLQLARKAPLTG